MQGLFSFCGVDIHDIGLLYAPLKANTYVYSPSKSNLYEQKLSGHNGAYYYGADTQAKDFVLRCYFEDSKITDGIMSNIYNLFRVGRTGKLVFRRRDWLWYTATVVSVDTSRIVSPRNGIVTINMRAYYPYARCDFSKIRRYYLDRYDILHNSSIVTEDVVLPSTSVATNINPVALNKLFLLYNAGTERAAVAILLAGDVGDGIVIQNKTTNQKARFVGLNKDITTYANNYLVSDGINGKTVMTDGERTLLAFLYHDFGFIDLLPALIMRNVKVEYAKDDKTRTYTLKLLSNVLLNIAGRYVYIKGEWYEILRHENDILYLKDDLGEEGLIVCHIARMNKMQLSSGADFELTRLNFVYSPTFS